MHILVKCLIHVHRFVQIAIAHIIGPFFDSSELVLGYDILAISAEAIG